VDYLPTVEIDGYEYSLRLDTRITIDGFYHDAVSR